MAVRISQHVVERFKERFPKQSRGKSDDYIRCIIRRAVITATEIDMTPEASARYSGSCRLARKYLRSGDIVFVMDGSHVVTVFSVSRRFVS